MRFQRPRRQESWPDRSEVMRDQRGNGFVVGLEAFAIGRSPWFCGDQTGAGVQVFVVLG